MNWHDAAAWLVWAGWFYAGWLFRDWSCRRSAKPRADIHPSWIDMSTSLVRNMRWIRDTHRFAGDEVEVRWDGFYTVEGLGRFAVTMKRADPVEA